MLQKEGMCGILDLYATSIGDFTCLSFRAKHRAGRPPARLFNYTIFLNICQCQNTIFGV